MSRDRAGLGDDRVSAVRGAEHVDAAGGGAVERETAVGGDRETAVLALRVHRAAPAGAGRAPAGAVLVHGLASNARMWDAVAQALAAQGVTAVAVDLRGHGRTASLAALAAGSTGDSSSTAEGTGTVAADGGPHSTATAAADVADVVTALRADGTLPGRVLLAGQSWGGNVVLAGAATRPGLVDALALVDGGWLRFDRSEPFEQLWQRLAPPDWAGVTWAQVERRLADVLDGWGPHALPAVLANLTTDPGGRVRNVLDRDAHQQILRSMYDGDPRLLYPAVQVPVLLAPAGSGGASALVHEAVQGLGGSILRRYDGSHHDLHLQHPRRLAADLLELLELTTTPQEDR